MLHEKSRNRIRPTQLDILTYTSYFKISTKYKEKLKSI